MTDRIITDPYDRTPTFTGTGADMWREYCVTYGEEDARRICNDYLDMQYQAMLKTPNAQEDQFCRELFAAMHQ